MKPISKAKIIKIQTLISRQDLRDEKEALVRRFSSRKSGSVADLLDDEANQLITVLERAGSGTAQDPDEEAKERMRNKILYYGHMLGWDEPRNDSQKRMTSGQINYVNVDAFCRSSKSKVCTHLRLMDKQQLNTMLTQMGELYKKTLERL